MFICDQTPGRFESRVEFVVARAFQRVMICRELRHMRWKAHATSPGRNVSVRDVVTPAAGVMLNQRRRDVTCFFRVIGIPAG